MRLLRSYIGQIDRMDVSKNFIKHENYHKSETEMNSSPSQRSSPSEGKYLNTLMMNPSKLSSRLGSFKVNNQFMIICLGVPRKEFNCELSKELYCG